MKRVQKLVVDYESGKKEETDRRTTYKNERNALEEEIAKLESRLRIAPEDDPAESEKIKQMNEQYQMVADRLQKQRLALVSTTKIFAFPEHLISSSGEESSRNLRFDASNR